MSIVLQWWIQDFPEGAPTPELGMKRHYLVKFFLKNCMEMKEIGPGGHASLPPWIRQSIDYLREIDYSILITHH